MNAIVERLRKPARADSSKEAGIVVSLLTVTPDIAADLLKLNKSNRKLNMNRVGMYRNMMQRGEWDDGVADICIDSRGRLVNGQHCLEAVVRSGKTVVATLKTGMPSRSQDVMDTQRSRTLGDQLQIEGFVNANVVAAIAKPIMVWRRDGDLMLASTVGGYSAVNADRRELLKFCRANRAELEHAAKLGEKRRLASGSLLTGQHTAALQIIFDDCAPVHAEAWLAELFGEANANSQPVAAYRNKLMKLRGTQHEWSPALKFVFAIKSFNAYMARKDLKMFRVKPAETVSIDVPEGVN